MIVSLHQFSGQETATRVLDCRLRKLPEGRASGSPLAGEIELQNISTSPIEIPIRTSPLQYLNLIVTDAEGRIVSTGHYGDLFSPGIEERLFRLLPGETFTSSVSLLATVPPAQRRPGIFAIRAIYEVDALRAESPSYILEW